MRRGRDTAACDELGRTVLGAIEDGFDTLQAEGAPIACVAGCAFCCHLRVGAFAYEGIALLAHLRSALPPETARRIEALILANARRIDGLSVVEHYAARLPCAFLVEGRCSAYEVRPSSCARYHSMSRAHCERSFANPRDMGTPRNSRPALRELQDRGAAIDVAATVALTDAGLSPVKHELHQLLRALIEDPARAERWQSGGEVDLPPMPS